MKTIHSVAYIFAALLFCSGIAIAEPLSISEKDDIESVLKAHNGKRVTVKLVSGDELTGTIGAVNDNVVYLRELSGKEFFDAVVNTDEISAVIIRTREQ